MHLVHRFRSFPCNFLDFLGIFKKKKRKKCMSQLPNDSETSGYSTSASSEFGSLDDGFKFPATMASKSGTKRRAEEKVENLDEILKSSLVLSPGKRLRFQSPSEGNTSSRCLSDEETIEANKRGRPPTRRSTSPHFRATRAPSTGGSIEAIRTVNAICSDSISPKLMGAASPRRRPTDHTASVYSKHRLGATFSPLVAGAKKKPATPISIRGGLTSRQSPLNSPRQGGLRSRGTPRGRPLLSDRFNLLLD